MADFFQTGAIATLHRLGPPNVARLEASLCALAKKTPVALVLPCHVRELGTPALERILSELQAVRYLRQIIVGIDGADTAAKWRRARKAFGVLPQETLMLWNDGPRISKLLRGFFRGERGPRRGGFQGKGRNVWLCLGAVLASGGAGIVATHDCDIANYSREMPARLCHPLLNASAGFGFCKGYYARVSDRLHGRVTRLLLAPMLRALRAIAGEHPLLEHLGAFRYPLAGEMALRVEQARRMRLPCGWALELGMLVESWRRSEPGSVCQAELCDNYDHRHQSLSPGDPSRGLHKVAREVALALLRSMKSEGVALDSGISRALQPAYEREAAGALRVYAADALINSLEYPRRDEELAVATFTRAIGEAVRAFHAAPDGDASLPSWESMEKESPDFLPALLEAIAADGRHR